MRFRIGEIYNEAKAQAKALAGGLSRVPCCTCGRAINCQGAGSRPHKPVRCQIRVATVDKWNKEQKMPSKRPAEGMLVRNILIRRLRGKEEIKTAKLKKHLNEEVEDE